MAEYFTVYLIEKAYGETYLITQAAYVISVILLLNDVKRTWKGILTKIGEIVLGIGFMLVMNSIVYMLIGPTHKDWLQMLLFILIYAIFRSRYRVAVRIVETSVFYSATFLNVVISEPWGDLFHALGYNLYGYMGITSLITGLLFFFMTWYLKKFTAEKLSYTPKFGVALMVVISAMAGISQFSFDWMIPSQTGSIRMYNVVISSSFWILELLAYYMFYVISKEYGENLELLAMQRKAETDREMYLATKTIYEEMSAMRHEIKNHDTYMRALLEKGDYKKMGEFLMSSQNDSSEFYQYVNCGNIVVNTIVNYEASLAKAHGIALKAGIVIPSKLPFRETELCSLLFNLLNNAIEACSAGHFEHPVIRLNMSQKGAYLFINVQNPVDDSIPAEERLKLGTTKENKRLHGFGTKVISMIVEKYNGHIRYTMQDGIFTADVMLELKEGEDGCGETEDRDL